MSDYKENVNSLREHADMIEKSGAEVYGPSATRLLVYDLRNAAAAIEALQAAVESLDESCKKQLVAMASHVAELQAAQPHWTRCDQEPPPMGKRVAVYDGDSIWFVRRVEDMDCGIPIPYWENEDGSWERLCGYHYWMPIEPPKEDA